MAMVLGLMEKGWPLTHCVYFDTGMEFSCIRKNIEKVRLELEQYGCELVILQPERHFLEEMLLRRIKWIIALWKLLVRWAMPLDDTP